MMTADTAPDPRGTTALRDGCCSGCGEHPDTGSARTPSERRDEIRAAFVVRGLDCAEEVAILRQAVGPLVGGEEHLSFDLLNGRMLVLASAAEVPVEEILRVVASTGMSAELLDGSGRTGKQEERRGALLLTLLSGLSLLGGVVYHVAHAASPDTVLRLFAGHEGTVPPLPELIFYAAAIATGIPRVAVKAWYAARRLRPDMNVLMTVAVSGAIVIGQWFEAAAVTFLFALSLLLESWSVARARRAIGELLDLAPPVARMRTGEIEREVPVDRVPVGARIVILPGERIPLDGTVIEGSGSVNQAPITGESKPVPKGPGDIVYAGSINLDGVIEVRVSHPASDTMLARILRMVAEAQSRRAAVEQWVERFARIYTPTVMVLALLIFLVPPLVAGGGWSAWLYRALVLLVIACPCALVISTPVSIVSAIAAAARRGVLVKGGSFLELVSQLQAIAFDKTGTLTRGELALVAIVPARGCSEEQLLRCAAALEARSLHPLARAIVREAERRKLAIEQAEAVRNLPGKGLEGRLGESGIWIGSVGWIRERGIAPGELAGALEKLEKEGCTVIAVGSGDRLLGLLGLADQLRPEAPRVVAELKQLGIAHLVLLTGDNRVTAETIARQVGIPEVRAELLPDEKMKAIEQLVARHRIVAMVGDGVNDAPAMARASFGIAMGAIGSDLAIETADIALMNDRLERLPWLVRHGRRMMGIVRQNIGFALGVKLLFLGLAVVGIATLWGAIAADVGATLLVIANALRLLRSPS